ncbi:MAG TPA: hypothetical protein VMV56_11105 [Williamwhitmania sp.]|nr:hypothetical protein [Williamwhitmania sp.]
MYITPFRLVLLTFIAIFLGFNIPMLITSLQQGTSLTNPVLNISGLALLGLVVVLNQVFQNRKSKVDVEKQ